MSTDSRPRIRQLSAAVVNKIAAGEVIERPASVLKELLENAVDADSDRIDVALDKGGSDAIRVSDNGCGITRDDMHLAVASHATSKIRSADDLFAVGTLGFRGEALASIAEVSHFRLRSKCPGEASGYELQVVGGKASEIAPCACGVGTTVEVRDLFFNTPVRRRFMRTTQTELGHATEAFTRVALAHPSKSFSLSHNQRNLFELPAVEDWRQRIATLFGSELADSLIWVESDDGQVSLSGYVADPNQSRSNNKMQYLFLNGRHIRDRALQHALGEAYRGLLLHGRFPISFLRFQLPADSIDVNVHPTKLEVRFQDSGRVYSHLLGTLRSRFLSTDLTAKVQPTATDTSDFAQPAVDRNQAKAVQDSVTQWARGQTEHADPSSSDAYKENQTSLRFDSAHDRARLSRFPSPTPSRAESHHGVELRPSVDQRHGTAPPAPGDVRPAPSDLSATGSVAPMPTGDQANRESYTSRATALQAHNRYLVTESDEGLVVIDQHALHERILYEELREKVLAGAVETQRLLVPETVGLSPTEAAAVLQSKELLVDLGIHVEEFGGDTVLISAYPAMLANIDPTELLRQIAEQLADGQKVPDRREVLDELLHMISCKAAIKAGDRLSQEEIAALIDRRHLVQDSHHCPHGRPTTLVFTREELDRRFKRI